MRTLLLVLAACGGKEPAETDPGGTPPTGTDTDADSDTDTDKPTDTDTDTPTDTDTDTTPPVDTAVSRDGTWSGDLTIDAGEGGFAYWTASCTVPLVVTIDSALSPPLAGTATCSFPDPMGGTMTVTLAGEISADPALGGTARVQRYDVDQTGALTGTFTGPDTLNVEFHGDYAAGDYTLSWDASALLTRP